MNLFFDVDYTLIDADGAMRPGVQWGFEQLSAEGHRIHLWSGLGPRWEVVADGRLEPWVVACFFKPLYDHREMLAPLGIEAPPDFVVDDHPHLVHVFGGLVVTPYRRPDPGDTEMQRVVEAVRSRVHRDTG